MGQPAIAQPSQARGTRTAMAGSPSLAVGIWPNVAVRAFAAAVSRARPAVPL